MSLRLYPAAHHPASTSILTDNPQPHTYHNSENLHTTNMGRSFIKKLKGWIDDIPDNKLNGAYLERGLVFIDKIGRLDCEGLTSDEPKRFNLQVHVHREGLMYTFNRLTIKESLKASITGFQATPPKVKTENSKDKDMEDRKDDSKKKKEA
ncbi:hypothetical protein CC86DRAFT_399574 [Ophiobolus disseminans]|uniref:Uncharacterized protein n=1 Tax=Ophiobolus disseminans TaxID=1469910 RepID=A0A6A7AJN5_9PLEO|nr:hypothetical protein CC86DRAFT_399574 [Ophiobolus disseminans]